MKKVYALFFCSILMIAVATAAVIEMPVAPAIAHMGTMIIGGGVPEEPAGDDDCSGSLVVSMHFEGTDDADRSNPTTGTPVGCTDFSTEQWTEFGAHDFVDTPTAKDGTYSSRTQNLDTIYVSVDDEKINDEAGTYKAWVYVDTWVDEAYLFHISGDNSNEVQGRVAGGSSSDIEFMIYYEGETGGYASQFAETDGVNGAEDTWYYVVAKWRQASSPYLSIEVFSDEEVTLLDSAEDTDALAAWDVATDWMGIGNYVAKDAIIISDSVYFYNAWE